jgi:twinkle protein
MQQQRSYYSLADLPQQPSIADSAVSTGWWELDKIFKLYPGQFVVVTGLAGSGKSSFLFSMLTNMGRQLGTRTFMYVPENEQRLRDTLRRIWSGDPAGFDLYAKDQCFIQSSVMPCYDDEPHDLRWVLDRAVEAIARDQVDVVLIDPWNELEHCKHNNTLMSDFIRQALMYLKGICRTHNVTAIMVAHPTKAVTEHGGRVPLLSDIEGSMNWFNKTDNGLIVVRDYEKGTARVISAKVREIGAGKIGTCYFYVDPETGRFTPQVGGVY